MLITNSRYFEGCLCGVDFLALKPLTNQVWLIVLADSIQKFGLTYAVLRHHPLSFCYAITTCVFGVFVLIKTYFVNVCGF